jgi:hypothetical protein
MDLFKNEVVRALIDYKWPLVRTYTIRTLFIPFSLYLASFIIFSNIFNGQLLPLEDDS